MNDLIDSVINHIIVHGKRNTADGGPPPGQQDYRIGEVAFDVPVMIMDDDPDELAIHSLCCSVQVQAEGSDKTHTFTVEASFAQILGMIESARNKTKGRFGTWLLPLAHQRMMSGS